MPIVQSLYYSVYLHNEIKKIFKVLCGFQSIFENLNEHKFWGCDLPMGII